MLNENHIRKGFSNVLQTIVFALLVTLSLNATAQNRSFQGSPVRKDLLVQALKIKQLNSDEIIEIIKKHGVNFQFNQKVEKELQNAGATADITEAVQQNYRSSDDNSLSLSILNKRAKSLPEPIYPPAAKAVRARGEVKVMVIIDESGNVSSASAISGHPLLRYEAQKAALIAKFNPTIVKGKPVKGSGILIYTFIP